MIDAITGVFTELGEWIVGQLQSVMTLFYANEQLTLLGVLAVIGVGIGTVLLIINIVKDFMRFR